jgi:hypothetical protein
MAFEAAGRPADAARAERQAIELDAQTWIPLFTRSMRELREGQLAAAAVTMEQAYSFAPWSLPTLGLLSGTLMVRGDSQRGQDLLRTIGDGEAYGAPFALLLHFLVRQDLAQAAHWAARGIAQRDLVIPFMVRHPIADGLRASLHWPALARLMNLPDTIP